MKRNGIVALNCNGPPLLVVSSSYRTDEAVPAIVGTEDGKPVAALVDVALFERIRRLRDEFLRVTDALGKAYEGVDSGAAQVEIEEAVGAARNDRVKRTQLGRKAKKP